MSPKEQSDAVVLLNNWARATWARMRAVHARDPDAPQPSDGPALSAAELELLAETERFLRLDSGGSLD